MGSRMPSRAKLLFQSTPSARRTAQFCKRKTARFNISIHALREEDGERRLASGLTEDISIHALREEDGLS